MGCIKFPRPCEHRPSRRSPQPTRQSVPFPHRPQIPQKGPEIPVSHRLCEAVCHGKGESRPLQQRAEISNLTHRQDAWRQAARHFRLRLRQTGAQFRQGLPTKQETKEQTIRTQGAPTLDKLTNRIIGPMQRQTVDHQIVTARLELQHVLVRHNPRFEKGPATWKPGHDGRCRKGLVNLLQPLLHFKAHLRMQKQGVRPRPRPVPQKGRAVDQQRGSGWACRHGADLVQKDLRMQSLIRVLYPPQCLTCDELVQQDFALCPACWRDTPFVTGLTCDSCGTPLPGDPGEVAQCDDCLRLARPWAQGRAVFLYRGKARDLVLALKHSDRMELAKVAAGWLHRSTQPILRPGMILAPVPLHWFRLIRRRYNQSALLSSHLARLAGLQHCPDLLVRTRRTPTQDGRDRDARFRNLTGAIRANPRRLALLEGREVLLIDDVMTSGATLAASTEACLAAGATRVSVAVLARVAKDA